MKKEGYLIKRKARGMWVYKYKDSDGKERTKFIAPIAVKRDEALMLVGKMNLDVASDGGPSVSFNALLNFYYRTKEYKKPSTKVTETQILEACREKWGSHVATEIKPVELKKWLKSMTHHKTHALLSNITVAKYRTVMGGIYRHAQRENFLPPGEQYRPCDLVRLPATSDYESIVFTPEQTAAVLAHLKSPEREMLLLACATGMRASEVCGLKWQDVGFQTGELNIRQTYVRGKIQDGAKTKASRGIVALPEQLVTELIAWRKSSIRSQDGDFIFPSPNLGGSKPRQASAVVQKHIQPAAVAAGLLIREDGKLVTAAHKPVTRFGFHAFRHSFATSLAASGASEKTIQDTMRHAQFRMSAQYIKTSFDQKRDATSLIFGQILGHQTGHQKGVDSNGFGAVDGTPSESKQLYLQQKIKV